MNTITICPLQKNDLNEIVSAFEKIGWNKPISIYESYLAAENYLVKPTEYKPCPGLYRHALRDLKLFDRVI